MTERGLPIAGGAPACPFVAFEDDRDARSGAPDHGHRCFAEPTPASRALAHQEAYCLSSAFPVCPTFQDWARREAAAARATTAAAPQGTEAPAADGVEPGRSEVSAPAPAPGPAPAPSFLDRPLPPPPGSRDLSRAPLPPQPPRRNPPRDWAAPPPWVDEDGQPADAPQYAPPARDVRDAWQGRGASADRDRRPLESQGLAGSAADLLAGGDPDVPVPVRRPGSPASAAPAPAPAAADDLDDDWPGAGTAAVGRAGQGGIPPRSSSGRPPAQQDRDRGRGRGGDRDRDPAPARDHRRAPADQDPADLFGPAWESPRRFEAYPALRTRIGLPSFGRIPSIGVAAVALVLASLFLFFVGPMLLGIGVKDQGAATEAPSAEVTEAPTATPEITPEPAPTPQIYVVKDGDTMGGIAKKNGVTLEALLKANPQVKNPDRIKAGDKLTIPVPDAVIDDSGTVTAAPESTTP